MGKEKLGPRGGAQEAKAPENFLKACDKETPSETSKKAAGNIPENVVEQMRNSMENNCDDQPES